GTLTSSTFDTATTSNFNQIIWAPTSQPAALDDPNVRFQLASNNDQVTWSFIGPDGTAGSFYDVYNTNIHSSHNNTQYFRYKVFLDTASSTYTPTISDVALTFTSECIPPGQVIFSGLSTSGGDYTLEVSHPGYADYDTTVPVTSSWQSVEVILSPQ